MAKNVILKNESGEELHPKTEIAQVDGLQGALNGKQPSGNYLTSQSLKTINGQSIVGSGNLSISGENESWRGKVVCVLGDSISTMKGCIPVADGFNEEHPSAYPGQGVTTWNQTWWGQVIQNLGAKLGINDSWSGSRVQNTYEADNPGGNVGAKVCMPSMTRVTNLGSNGTPDLILFFGGTNDGKFSTFGEWDDTADYTVDTTAKTWTSFQDAYAAALMRMQYLYPNARIVTFCPMYVSNWYTDGKLSVMCKLIKEISDYFGCTCVDFRKCGINKQNLLSYLGDGLHPNAEGMTLMANYATEKILELEVKEGENVVYSITNDLANASSDKAYIKGVSAGKAYTATLNATSGITVHMGGKDVTSSVFSNGVVSISSVTGDVVISDSGYIPPAVQTYTIKFINYDGTVLQTSTLESGQIPSYTGATPVRASDGSYTYEFSGWSPSIVAVSGNATYTAQYTATPIEDDEEDEGSYTYEVIGPDYSTLASNFSFGYAAGAVTFSNSSTYSQYYGQTIEAVKLRGSEAGAIGYGLVAEDGDTYTSMGTFTVEAQNATDDPRWYPLPVPVTIGSGQRLAIMGYSESKGKIWVSTTATETLANVRTNIRSVGASKDETWKLPVAFGKKVPL